MRALSATMTLGLLLLVGVGGAAADPECVQEAKEQRGQCRLECEADFVVTRDICRSLDPECAAECRTAHAECRGVVVAALEQCVDGCRDQLNADRAACPRRGRGRDFCVDRAQIRAFLCRDDCRETLQVSQGLKSCRQTFGTCLGGCAVTGEPTPPPVPTATPTPEPEPTLTPLQPR